MARFKSGVKVRVIEGSFEGRIGTVRSPGDHSPQDFENGTTRVVLEGEEFPRIFHLHQLVSASLSNDMKFLSADAHDRAELNIWLHNLSLCPHLHKYEVNELTLTGTQLMMGCAMEPPEPAESPSAAERTPKYASAGVDGIKLKGHIVEPTSYSLYQSSYDEEAMRFEHPDIDHVQQATLTMLRALYLQAREHEAARQAERTRS